MPLLQDIQAQALQSNATKSTIATFLLDYLDQLENLSMEDIARETYTSKASLVRFAQSLGYKGWRDFYPALLKERFYQDSHYSEVDHNLPFSPDDSLATVIQKLATIEKESIQDTADRLDSQELAKACQLIEQAQRIVIFGLSPNNYLASIFRRKMIAIGKNVEVAQSGEFGITANSLSDKDLAIIISYSGNTPESESLRFLPRLKETGTALIGLTSETGHYVRSQIPLVFTICTRENHFKKIGNFSTEESILFLLNSLYSAYFSKNYWSHYSYKLHTLEELEKDRK